MFASSTTVTCYGCYFNGNSDSSVSTGDDVYIVIFHAIGLQQARMVRAEGTVLTATAARTTPPIDSGDCTACGAGT